MSAQPFSGLPPDQAAWLPVARAVVAGTYDGARRGSSVRDSLEIGLRSVAHPTCEAAIRRLAKMDAPKARARKGQEELA